jgi:hypothetical protein
MANLVYSFQVTDGDGNVTAVTVYAKHASATLAQLQSWGTDMSELIDGALDGKVTKASLLVDVTLGDVKSDAAAGSNIQETALITFDCASTPYNFSLDFPAWNDDAFTGKAVDETNAAYQALRDYLITASNTIVGTDRYGNALTAVNKARKTFRKFRKQAARA